MVLASITLDVGISHIKNYLERVIQRETNWLVQQVVDVMQTKSVLVFVGCEPIVTHIGHDELHAVIVASRSVDQ